MPSLSTTSRRPRAIRVVGRPGAPWIHAALAATFAIPLALGACRDDPTGSAPEAPPPPPLHSVDEGPPPDYDFGPDTRQTGLFTGEGTTGTGLSCGGSGRDGRSCSGFLASDVDGTRLGVRIDVPHGGGPHPVVVLLHGWGGSKESSDDIAARLTEGGYAVLRYSARGFGDSWGQVNLSDVAVELHDLRSVLGQVVDLPGLRLDPDAVAVTGVSYGGGQSWLALLTPRFTSPGGRSVRIRTVVPIVPWSDLLYALLPNGRPHFSVEPLGAPKLSYIGGLFVSGLRDDPERPYPNYPEYLTAWNAWIHATEPDGSDPVWSTIRDGLAGYRSVWWQDALWRDVVAERVPVFQVQGFTDDLFPAPEALRMLLALRDVDPTYPIRSYFGDIGHPRAANKPEEMDYVLASIEAWLGFYLKGEGSEPLHDVEAAVTRPRDQAFDPADVVRVAHWEDLADRVVPHALEGAAVLVNPLSDPLAGFFWDPLVMEAARELEPLPPAPPSAVSEESLAGYEVPVATLSGGGALLIAGRPIVRLRAVGTGVRVQLDVRLFDVEPGGGEHLVTRGTVTVSPGPGEPIEVEIPTYGNLWEAGGDDVLRLEVTNLDSPYLSPSKIPSVTEIDEVRLELPVRGGS